MTEELYKIFKNFKKITTDSRNVPEGSIFWALRGDKFDGNKYVKDALSKGAAFAVIDNDDFFIEGKTFLVKDTLKALQELANYHRKQINIPVLTLTGTNGKTTTKELIKSVLQTQMNVKATKGNLNNHIGVPLTLLSFDENTEIGIVEAGANHPGEIEQLCKIAEPDYGLITNIGKAHLEGFGSFEGVIKTKTELYGSVIKNNGIIFYNSDNEILTKADKGKRTVSYGTRLENDLTGELISALPFLKIKITTEKNKITEINTKLTGKYNFENILAAACIGNYFGINSENIKKGIENYVPANNRSQLTETERNTILLDAYNANPSSMKTALENFTEYPDENKMIILGDMFELGKYSKAEHTEILKKLKNILKENKTVKKVIVCGKYFEEAFDTDFKKAGILHFPNTENLKKYLSENKHENNLILIKGSRSMKMEELTGVL